MLKEKLSRAVNLRAMEKLASRVSLNAIKDQVSKLMKRSPKVWPKSLGFLSERKTSPLLDLDGSLYSIAYNPPLRPTKIFRGHAYPNPFTHHREYGDTVHFSPNYNTAAYYSKYSRPLSGLNLKFLSAGTPTNPERLPLFRDYGIERGQRGVTWEELGKQYEAVVSRAQQLSYYQKPRSPRELEKARKELEQLYWISKNLGNLTYETPVRPKDLSGLNTFITVPGEGPLTVSEESLIQTTGNPKWEELLSDIMKYYKNNPSQQY